MASYFRCTWLVCALAWSSGLFASEAPASMPVRPRIGLVLSGGGARGMAHIGVLKVLEELKVPIDCVAGTSMGAIVGGLYASGMSARDIDALMRSVDWQDAFRDRPVRRNLAFRRKQDDRNFLVRLPLGVKGGEVLLPRGLIQGQKLQQTLRRLTVGQAEQIDFDALATPFRAVATDLENGQIVVMGNGDLATAMRASMSAPGVFAPVERDGRLLVDGGLSENLPLDVARAMGADIVIVVDVSFPLLKRSSLKSALTMSTQMLAILLRKDAERQKATLAARDVLVEPQLGEAASTDFTKVAESIALGENAARAMQGQLAALSVDGPAYAEFLAARSARDAAARPEIDFVRVDARSKHYERTIQAALSPAIGRTFDSGFVEKKITELYGLDLFESLDYGVVAAAAGEAGLHGLEIRARRKSWGPNYLRFGLNLQDDFEGSSTYNAAMRFIVTELNDLGGEWITDLQIGDSPKVFSEFYQPFTADRRWFIAPSVRAEVKNVPFLVGDLRIGELRVRSGLFGLDVGRELGNYGELRAGLRRSSGSSTARIGDPADPRLAKKRFQSGEYFYRFSYDRLDNVNFPRQGSQFSLQWNAARTDLGADSGSDRVEADWLYATSRGRNTYILWTSAGTTLDSDKSIQNFYSLGGLFNLSGISPDALSGPHFGVARAIYFRKVGRGGEGLFNAPVYLGASFEMGNVWQQRSEASLRGSRKNTAVFLGLDTLAGPIYLGAGFDDSGGNAFYLLLGRTF
jgi:NTE family protein